MGNSGGTAFGTSSVVLTGTPTAPTAAPGDQSTQIATDAFAITPVDPLLAQQYR